MGVADKNEVLTIHQEFLMSGQPAVNEYNQLMYSEGHNEKNGTEHLRVCPKCMDMVLLN